jgi:hypothetical protein
MARGAPVSFRRLQFAVVGPRQRLGEKGFERTPAGFVGGGEACL